MGPLSLVLQRCIVSPCAEVCQRKYTATTDRNLKVPKIVGTDIEKRKWNKAFQRGRNDIDNICFVQHFRRHLHLAQNKGKKFKKFAELQ